MEYANHIENLELRKEFRQLNKQSDLIDQLFDQVIALQASVEQFGTSLPVMQLVDPDGVLCSHENLGIIPVKDETSEVCLENLGDTLKKIAKALTDFFKKLVDYLKRFFLFIAGGSKKRKGNLKTAVDTNKQTVDKAKKTNSPQEFKDKKDSANEKTGAAIYSAKDLRLYEAACIEIIKFSERFLSELEMIVTRRDSDDVIMADEFSFESFDTDAPSKIFGLSISNDNKEIIFGKATVTPKNQSLADAGYDIADISQLSTTVGNIYDDVDKLNEISQRFTIFVEEHLVKPMRKINNTSNQQPELRGINSRKISAYWQIKDATGMLQSLISNTITSGISTGGVLASLIFAATKKLN